MSDNSVTLVGNLTDSPELRFTPNGTAVASIRLAVTPRIRERDGWKDGEPSFFRVNVWRDLAEQCRLAVQGRPGGGGRAAADPLLGDLQGRQALRRRGRGRGDRPQPEVRHRQAAADPRAGHRHPAHVGVVVT
jgi:hypothetical protein